MTRPEHLMVRRALKGGAVALLPAAGAGYLADAADGAISAVLGVLIIVMNFAVHGLSLAWAAGTSIAAVQGVALGGFVARMAAIVGSLFALSQTSFFSPVVFGIAVMTSTLALLGYEARLFLGQRGSGLEIPPDRVAVAARDRLRAREEAFR